MSDVLDNVSDFLSANDGAVVLFDAPYRLKNYSPNDTSAIDGFLLDNGFDVESNGVILYDIVHDNCIVIQHPKASLKHVSYKDNPDSSWNMGYSVHTNEC